VLERIWIKRPDGFTIEMPTWHRDDRWISHPGIQENVLCDWSMNRESEELYIKISERDLKDLHDNLDYFKVPQTGIESIR
jgi:hypothetical protein